MTPTAATTLIGQKRKSMEIEIPEDFCSIETGAPPMWPHAKNLWFPAAKAYHETMTPSAISSESVGLSLQVILLHSLTSVLIFF